MARWSLFFVGVELCDRAARMFLCPDVVADLCRFLAFCGVFFFVDDVGVAKDV